MSMNHAQARWMVKVRGVPVTAQIYCRLRSYCLVCPGSRLLLQATHDLDTALYSVRSWQYQESGSEDLLCLQIA